MFRTTSGAELIAEQGQSSIAVDMCSPEGRELATALITAPGVGRGVLVDSVFVTHSADEAVFLGSRIVVLSARPGRIALDLSVDLPRTGVDPDELRGLPSTPRCGPKSDTR